MIDGDEQRKAYDEFELVTSRIDPLCPLHSLRRSAHDCLYCCMCFEDLTELECHLLPDGSREDVCYPCAAKEAEMLAASGLKRYNQTDGN